VTEDLENREGKRLLIVTIVIKGLGDTVIEASMKAGAEGGTILFGRGAGIHEKKRILGIPVEPEKEIILTVTPPNKADSILNEIIKAARLGEPRRGIAFTVPIDQFVGVAHAILDDLPQEPQPGSDQQVK
jgi:nitrogen regulatory protein P-II 1